MSQEVSKNHQRVLDFADQGDIVDGILEMPTLWSLDKHGKYRYWNLNIGIENYETEKQLNVNKDYINHKELPKGYVGYYYTESGVEDTPRPIISDKKYVKTGKSLKSKAYTTPFTQAILDARSDYNYKVRKGSVLEKELLNPPETIISIEELMTQTHRGSRPWRIFAMAYHDVNKSNNWRHIKYPCVLQPKLDGTMFICVYHPALPEIELTHPTVNGKTLKVHMDSYSRGREDYEGQSHVLLELYPILKKHPGLHLVGELWKKGYGLQDISGSSRRQLDSKIKTDSVKLDFNIFDCFYIEKPELTFDEREIKITEVIEDLRSYQNTLSKDGIKESHVKQVPSYKMESKAQLIEKYQIFLSEKFEGGVIRNLDSLHEFGIDKEKRSYTALKIKPRDDAEWPIVGFKEGKGKEEGAVIWICAENDEGYKNRLSLTELTADQLLLENRKQFSITPNMDYETRYQIYSLLTKDSQFFEDNIKGALYTISYSILSKDFIPQQPKGLRFHNPKIEELLTNLD